MKIIKVVGKNITGLDFPMFLVERKDGSRIYLSEDLVYETNYTQLSLFNLEGEEENETT